MRGKASGGAVAGSPVIIPVLMVPAGPWPYLLPFNFPAIASQPGSPRQSPKPAFSVPALQDEPMDIAIRCICCVAMPARMVPPVS